MRRFRYIVGGDVGWVSRGFFGVAGGLLLPVAADVMDGV